MSTTCRLTRAAAHWQKPPTLMAGRILSALLALALFACAGPGHIYTCDADAGPCLGQPGVDGGAFVGQQAVMAHDGQHNGYTDVAIFAGAAYSVYRHGTYRGYDGTAEVRIARSPDKGQSWQAQAAFSLPGYDLRDPKLVAFQDRLLVTFTAWDVRDPTQNRALVRARAS